MHLPIQTENSSTRKKVNIEPKMRMKCLRYLEGYQTITKKKRQAVFPLVALGRGEKTRTSDLHVPNVAR